MSLLLIISHMALSAPCLLLELFFVPAAQSPPDALELCRSLARLDNRYPPKLLYHSPSSSGQGRKNTTKGSWVEIRTRRDHSLITVMGKAD